MFGRQAQREHKGRSTRALVHARTVWSKILTQDPAHADTLSAVLEPGDHECSAKKRMPIVSSIRVRFTLAAELDHGRGPVLPVQYLY